MSILTDNKVALIVDDDPTQRALLNAALASENFAVVEACNGREALEKLAEIPASIVLLDVEMPELNGFDTCRAIREIPEHRDTPVVMVTGKEDTESVDRAYLVGATDFFAKPINWSLLGHRIRYILRTSFVSRGLRESEAKNRAFISAIPDIMVVLDIENRCIEKAGGGSEVSSGWLFSREIRVPFDQLPPELVRTWLSQFRKVSQTGETQQGEFSQRLDGETHNFETRMVPFTEQRTLLMIRDISAQKQATAKVYQLAYFDTLTGLPNRQSFLTQLSQGIREAEESGNSLSVLYLDLDNFKRINDSLGHSIGDRLLKIISSRIEKCVRADDYVARYGRSQSDLQLARLGGDEFTILLNNLQSGDEAEVIARRITESVSQPIQQDDHEFVITPSIGIATFPEDGRDIDTLVKNADTAMYHAKEAGKNSHQMFSGTMSVRSLEHLELEHALRHAISHDELDLHYQPKLSLADNRISGVEALLRWTHPERGPISPAKFIPIAEDSGLIVDLSHWVLHTACKLLRQWEHTPLRDVPIAVNLSGKQFTSSDIYKVVTDTIEEYSIDPAAIDLELTESELMRDADGTIGTLRRLKEAGLSLIVDDFGTGYSSLSYLMKFPIDALKIDRSFVMDIHKSADNRSICDAIIALAHRLNLKVVAEGVEKRRHIELLKELKCDEIQGFYFCKPVSAVEVADFIAKHRRTSAERDSSGLGIA